MTRVSATGFESGTVRLRIQRATTAPSRHTEVTEDQINSNEIEQGHHHNGDQAARRHHMTCSICGRRFATARFGVRVGSGMVA